jgi:hypothetical protein
MQEVVTEFITYDSMIKDPGAKRGSSMAGGPPRFGMNTGC